MPVKLVTNQLKVEANEKSDGGEGVICQHTSSATRVSGTFPILFGFVLCSPSGI